MITLDFCTRLEYEICRLLEKNLDENIKGFWCDGILLSEPESSYTKKYVNDNRQIKLDAFAGKGGQDKYELILKFGNKSLSRYMQSPDISESLTNLIQDELFTIDTVNRRMEIQLK